MGVILSINPENTQIFENLISNSKFKKEIVSSLEIILSSIYEPKKRWYCKKHGEREICGVIFNKKDTSYWSHINRLNTNYSALTHLYNKVRELNPEVDIDFTNKDYFSSLSRIRLMMRLVNIDKKILLDDENPFYHELEEICKHSWKRGQKYTEDFVKNHKIYFPNSISVINNDDLPGDTVDMVEGIDVVLVLEGNLNKNVQVKSVKKIEQSSDTFDVQVSMTIEKYKNIDIFAFYENRNRKIYFFDYSSKNEVKSISENTPVFSFPKNSIINVLDYAESFT